MPEPRDNTQARDTSVGVRRVRVVLLVLGIAAAAVGAVACGAISLTGGAISPSGPGTGSHAQSSPAAELAARREAAERQWATATCTNILDWKNEIRRDGTSLDLGLSPWARIKKSITATDRLLRELDRRGMPPTARNAQARVEGERLRSEIESRLHSMEGTARSVGSGNLLAIGTLVSELAKTRALGTQITSELRHVVSVDLGLSLVETRPCRQLVGIPL